MSNGVNGSSTVSTNQEFLREIALMGKHKG